jgi:F0F1-type ATP synthase membrane subunit c/vacuolar-type H+-ATPase subunit K
MDPDEAARRRSMLIHLALLAALGMYGVLLVQVWRRTGSHRGPATDSPLWFVALLGVSGIALGLGVLLGKRLPSGSGKPSDRVRRLFIIRATLAESVGVYGLLLGYLGAVLGQVAVLFAIALAAMLVWAPTREAWQNALRLAENKGP